MATLGRFLRPTTLGASRRLYSVFSSKPGGGRYFNSAKPHKAVATNHTTKRSANEQTTPSSSSSSTPSGSTNNSSGTADASVLTSPSLSQPAAAEDIQATPATAKKAAPISSDVASPPPVESVTPPAPFHPSFSAQTYPLHQFFSGHRPLLNLFLPTAALFEPSQTSNDLDFFGADSETSLSSLEQLQQHLQSHTEDYSADADADAARQLARALAVNRLGGAVSWDDTLAHLGDAESISIQQRLGERVSLTPPTDWIKEMSLDSTKRKRRGKMSKHKFKKRRRLQRAERRKMGK